MTWPAIGEHRDYIRAQLGRGHGLDDPSAAARRARAWRVSVASLRRYVAANLPEETRRPQVRCCADPAEAGQEAQIDYGTSGRWIDPATGRRHGLGVRDGAGVLPAHVRPAGAPDGPAGLDRRHVAAFAFFGGVPARLVPDNLKTGVDQPDLYDPKINRSYAELAAHYGCLIDPARAPSPRTNPGRTADAVCAGLLLAGPGVHQAGADAGRGRALVARRSPGAGPAGRWTAPPRPRCSTRPRRTRCGRCRPSRSCWPRGRRRRSARTSTSRSASAVLGAVAADRQDRRRAHHRDAWCSSSTAASWSRPTPARPAASRPTSATTRRRRSRSTCGPRPGAASQAAAIGPACEQVIAELLEVNALYRLRAAQGVIGLADKHGPAGSKRPARRRSRSVTRPTAPSRASSPPAPKRDQPPGGRPGTAVLPRSCAARLRRTSPHAAARSPARRRVAGKRTAGPRHDRRHPHAGTSALPPPGPGRPDPRAAAVAAFIELAGSPAWSMTRRRRRRHHPGARSPAPRPGAPGRRHARPRRRRPRSPRHPPRPEPPLPRRRADPQPRPPHLHRHHRGSTMTDRTVTDRSALQRAAALKLTGMLDTLDARLAQTRAGNLGHLEFLQVLCEDEITRRETAALTRRIRRARFESRPPWRIRLHRQPEAPRRADPRPGRPALAGRRRIGHPLRARRRRQNPCRPSTRPPRHPPRRRSPVRQDQPGPGRPRRWPRRPHLGQAAPRTHPPRRPDPRRLRHPRAHRTPRPTTSTN